MDQPDGFAGNDCRNIVIADGLGRGIFGCDRLYILQELKFRPAQRRA